MTTIRWESRIASWRLWVTKTTVFRVRAQMPRSHSPMRSRVCSSSAPNGSSIRRIGRVEGERPRDGDPLLHPPDSSRGYRASKPAEPHRLEERAGALAPRRGRHALELEPELDVLERRAPGEEPGVLEDHRHLPRVGPVAGRPAIRTSPGVGRR